MNSTELALSGTIQVNISEFNSLQMPNNVTKGGNWQIQAALSSCPNTNDLPFGIAVYKGHYGSQNVSQGTQLQIFSVTACPQYIRLVTGYAFQADSDVATILPGSGVTQISATANIVTGGTSQTGQAPPLGPGQYTIVGADEWGALAFLYIQLNPLP